ncbi:hypothetical protein POX_d05364 [Penicillium oxalicum]|uniref:DUF7719 domain-containing protein n=1 Tax=Penicillium oxalicum (strain 114-2 / CGMCC 5302) TaxID=933388 RepID=S7ZUP8_PENO1|nr:hypothetical protein POX_d05364 [Penicillium oxalicum]EPS32476.1 hypothetical protein PDE_07436 [Penicillium oxalicum 114-2]KAI2789866.1 hypothetical protein POX_d05364 [Penicillium oxalicum]
MDAPRNRKQRRAAAAAANTTETTSEHPDIPLALPDRSQDGKRDTPTLYDIIEQRQRELLKQAESLNSQSAPGRSHIPSSRSSGTRIVTVDESGNLVDADGKIDSELLAGKREGGRRMQKQQRNAASKVDGDDGEDEEDAEIEVDDQPLPPLIDTILLSIPLTTLHLTLAYLAAHQYAESTNVPALIKESISITFPLLSFLVHLMHGHIVSFRLHHRLGFLTATSQPIAVLPLTREKFSMSFLRRLLFPPTARTIMLLPIAALLGAHLVAVTNGEPYYAVMKKAPAYGTMWIWCILEMSFGPAVLGALGPLVWGVYWKGYGIF